MEQGEKEGEREGRMKEISWFCMKSAPLTTTDCPFLFFPLPPCFLLPSLPPSVPFLFLSSFLLGRKPFFYKERNPSFLWNTQKSLGRLFRWKLMHGGYRWFCPDIKQWVLVSREAWSWPCKVLTDDLHCCLSSTQAVMEPGNEANITPPFLSPK